MTIEEVSELRKQEKNRTLRKPNCIKEPVTIVEKSLQQQKILIGNQICKLLNKKGVMQNFSYTSLLYKSIIRNSFAIKTFKGLGTKKRPYTIDSEFGKGKIWNAHEFFKKKKFPDYIEKKHCFGNCFTMAYNLAYHKIPAKVLSGISNNYDHSFLHSVIEAENKYIIDFNLNLCIDKDLYCKFFPFEVLSELEGKRILKDKDFVDSNIKVLKDMSIMYFNFAYDDVIDYIKNEERQQQNIEFVK